MTAKKETAPTTALDAVEAPVTLHAESVTIETPTTLAETGPLTAGEGELIAVRNGEERVFTRESWNIIKDDRAGWVEKKSNEAAPKDLK